MSNSYGGGEFAAASKYFKHKDVVDRRRAPATAGYGPQQPCSWATVVCVGGTTLSKVSPRTEASWTGAGSGCSAKVAKPAYQNDTRLHDAFGIRRIGDVANPAFPVAVYLQWRLHGHSAAPASHRRSSASVFALAGNHNTVNARKAIWAAGGSSNLNDVTTGGQNGSCPPAYPYICKPGVGLRRRDGLGIAQRHRRFLNTSRTTTARSAANRRAPFYRRIRASRFSPPAAQPPGPPAFGPLASYGESALRESAIG